MKCRLASLDFTGFTGHAMSAGAMHMYWADCHSPCTCNAATDGDGSRGVSLALAIALQCLETQNHAISELILGSSYSLAVSRLTMRWPTFFRSAAQAWDTHGFAELPAYPALANTTRSEPSTGHHVALSRPHRSHPRTRANLDCHGSNATQLFTCRLA